MDLTRTQLKTGPHNGDTPGFSILVLRVSRGPVSIPSICELCMKSGRGTVYEQHVNRSASFQSMNLPVVDKKKINQVLSLGHILKKERTLII